MVDWEKHASVERAGEVASALIDECAVTFDLGELRSDPVTVLADCEPLALVFEEALSSDRCGGGGYYRAEPPTIYLHPTIGRRDNFTVLHELGHHLQQHHDDWALVLLDLQIDRRRRVEEAVSNEFAAQVLMPITDKDREDAAVHPAEFMAGYYGRVSASRSASLRRARDILHGPSSRWILAVAELDGTVIYSATTYDDAQPPIGFRQEGFERVAREALDHPVRQHFREGIEYRTGSVLDDLHIEAAVDHSGRYAFVALRPTSVNGQGTMTYPVHECADPGCGATFEPSRSNGKCDLCGCFRCPECRKCACAAASRSALICDMCRMTYSQSEMQSGNHECF